MWAQSQSLFPVYWRSLVEIQIQKYLKSIYLTIIYIFSNYI